MHGEHSQQRTRSRLMQRAPVDGAGTEVEYEILGSPAGGPVLLIHGALLATAFAPLCAEPALATRARLIRYHRRGYAGSDHPDGPASIARQAADCRALLAYLGVARAHVVGHSSGGAIALQLALDAPEVVHSLVLLEPALLDVPSGALVEEAVGPALRLYEAGEKEAATDSFLRWAIGMEYRAFLDRLFPGGYDQVVADADTWFDEELPALQEWRFTREDAGRITQPVLSVLGGESAAGWPGWAEGHARVQEWLPQAEPFVLPGANHALQEMDPRGIAQALAAFFARHPVPATEPAMVAARASSPETAAGAR
jgi:pimeloyl-ACP methyl ester carboxylesterase